MTKKEYEKKVSDFYSVIKDKKAGEPFSRYKSWEYCHEIFNYYGRKEEITDEVYDLLALNLAFYLASWGMYRGSSFLLQRDYKTHIGAVKEIMKDKYKDLWNYDPSDKNNEELETDANRLVQLCLAIAKTYEPIEERNKQNDDLYTYVFEFGDKYIDVVIEKNNDEYVVKKGGKKAITIDNDKLKYNGVDLDFSLEDNFPVIDYSSKTIYRTKARDDTKKLLNVYNVENVSTILTTKIVMGTLGSVPAFDRFLISGLKSEKTYTIEGKEWNVVASFCKKTLLFTFKFYNEYLKDVTDLPPIYTPLKKVDMCFWQIGFEKDQNDV